MDLARRIGASVDAVGLALALTQPWCDVALSGAVTPDHVRSNVGAEDLKLTEDDVGALDAMIEDPDAYWSKRSALPWH